MLSLVKRSSKLLLLRCPNPAGRVVGKSCSFCVVITSFFAAAADCAFAKEVADFGTSVVGVGGGGGGALLFEDVAAAGSVLESEKRRHMLHFL